MTVALEDRIVELEERARRFKLATTGIEGWENYFQSLIVQERDYFTDLLTQVVAQLQREVLVEAKAMLDQALATRVRGTFQPGTKYVRGDMVVLGGASFIARCDNPGPCPGPHWQLTAKQGQRGVRGERGERGPPGPVISKWLLNRETFTATPVYDNGIFGPALELRELFEPSQSKTP